MIRKLSKIFSSLIVYKDEFNHFDTKYKWFSTDQNEIIGIKKEELTTKDTSLLSSFLQPYNIDFPVMTDEESKWKDIIHTSEKDRTIELETPFRFVYFSIKENQINPTSFKDAIQELFAKQVPILWENNHEGIIIEEQAIDDEGISYEQIIDILMSDPYVKINFFVGPFQQKLTGVKKHYHSLINDAETAFTYSKKAVVTYIEAVPFLFVDQMNSDLRTDVANTVLQEFTDDEDTLKMIEVFVQCNLNISETAKELYMHRNSLQYRLDRFFEKTEIDVRQFHHAMTVYLALLAKN